MAVVDPAADGWTTRNVPGLLATVGPLWARREGAGWAYGVAAHAGHANPAGLVHGGMLCTLLDHALSTIAWEANARRACFTVALNVQFLAAARPGDFVVARGRVVRQAASLVFLDGALSVGEATIATATAIMKVARDG